MVKHPQKIDHFVRLALKGITCPGGADFLSGINVCKLMLHPIEDFIRKEKYFHW